MRWIAVEKAKTKTQAKEQFLKNPRYSHCEIKQVKDGQTTGRWAVVYEDKREEMV